MLETATCFLCLYLLFNRVCTDVFTFDGVAAVVVGFLPLERHGALVVLRDLQVLRFTRRICGKTVLLLPLTHLPCIQ